MGDYERLRGLFVDGRVFGWRDGLPRASDPQSQTTLLLDYLMGQRNPAGQDALALFVATVRDTHNEQTGCYGDLDGLVVRLEELEQMPRPAPRLERSNPFYVTGRISDPTQFYGRERLLREVKMELVKRSSVSLVGASQVGKSSLLYYLYATRAEWLPTVQLVYVDLQAVWDGADFFATVLHQLGAQGDGPRALRRALRAQDVVLLLDEVEQLRGRGFDPKLQGFLRSMSQEAHVALCVASQRPMVEVFPPLVEEGVSPFHNVFIEWRVPLFSEAQTTAFLHWRLQGTGVVFNPAELAHIWQTSRGNPAQVQRAAWRLFREKSGA